MKWSLVLLVTYAGMVIAATSCGHAEYYFRSLNVTADNGDGTGAACGGHCCGRGREEELRIAIRKKMVSRTVSSLRPINDLLMSMHDTLQEHFTTLSRQSQNKTTQLFTQVYREHEIRTRAHVAAFYDDIREVLVTRSDLTIHKTHISTHPKILAASTTKFFRDVFPVAYHKVLKFDKKQLTPEYELCLRDAYYTVQPFGDVPEKLGKSLQKSLEGAKALMHALAYGAIVLSTSADLLKKNDDSYCSDVLMRAAACARCKGLNARPCKNYCLNVVRGCLGYLGELDAQWSKYVEDLERLTRSDTGETTLSSLDTKISDAVLQSLRNGATLEEKVQKECGKPTTLDTPVPTSSHSVHLRRDVIREPPHLTQMMEFLASLFEKRRIFENLSDRICDDPDLAHSNNTNCWTGDAVGEYTKTLGSSVEKNNPEVKVYNQKIHAEIFDLSVRMQNARTWFVDKYLRYELPGDAAMLRDQAGEDDGSGDHRYSEDDSDYDNIQGSGEGSGVGRIRDNTYDGEPRVPSKPATDAAAISRPGILFSFSLLSIILRSIT